MRRKKASSFLTLLESWFGTYLPTAKGLSSATIKSYKTAFRVLLEFMCSEKDILKSSAFFNRSISLLSQIVFGIK